MTSKKDSLGIVRMIPLDETPFGGGNSGRVRDASADQLM